jgi:site-specific DNA-cytosine methylase
VRALDVYGFAGGFTLGVVQSGWTLVGKREERPGFGIKNLEANRHLLPGPWEAQASDPDDWETVSDVQWVFGNPPCSGFSVMTDKKHRGVDARVNACMHHFGQFVGRQRPLVAVMESVRPAYSNGRSLMQLLRAKLEADTGLRYGLWHVMHNALDLGGAAYRPRYFWVASQVPFGVEWPNVRKPYLGDVITDLCGLSETWQPQPYRLPPTWYSEQFRSPSGFVDGHVTTSTPAVRRALEAAHYSGGWPPAWHLGKLLRVYYERTGGSLPPSWEYKREQLLSDNKGSGQFHLGYIQPTRWDPQARARVITGGASALVIHPFEDRPISYRECARIMGFPDDWRILPNRRASGMNLWWGKGITVANGRWMGNMVRNALEGSPGSVTGEEVGEREYLIRAPR